MDHKVSYPIRCCSSVQVGGTFRPVSTLQQITAADVSELAKWSKALKIFGAQHGTEPYSSHLSSGLEDVAASCGLLTKTDEKTKAGQTRFIINPSVKR